MTRFTIAQCKVYIFTIPLDETSRHGESNAWSPFDGCPGFDQFHSFHPCDTFHICTSAMYEPMNSMKRVILMGGPGFIGSIHFIHVKHVKDFTFSHVQFVNL